tara:strand:+ start:653 stop:862 length:210 start_codon:yes stop_codon:yes gene_type:complete
MKTSYPQSIIDSIANKALEKSNFSSQDIDRFCWMEVHQFHHGFLPSEYDIREIDEDLYLSVLESAKNKF